MDGYGSGNPEGLKVFIYRFLQRLFTEPDEEFYRFLLEHRVELGGIGIRLNNSLTLESFQTEYTLLFLGPEGHLPPYESVFLEGRFWGHAAVEVKDFIGRIGLELDGDFSMPPDHISVEFEVLEKLLASNHREAGMLYKDFFQQHILWVPAFLEMVILETRSSFYRTSFELAASFIKGETEELGLKPPVQ